MNSQIRRTLSVLAGVLVLAMLTGCGGQSPPSPAGSAAKPATEAPKPAPQAAPAAAQPAAPAAKPAAQAPKTPAVKDKLSEITIGVGGSSSLSYTPFILAMRLGYLDEAAKESGVKINVSPFKNGADAAQSQIAGQTHLSLNNVVEPIKASAQGLDQKWYMTFQDSLSVAVAMRKEVADQIKSLKDTEEMRWGITAFGAGTHMQLSAVAAANGLDTKKIKWTPVGTGSAAVAAVKAKKVDVWSGSNPQVTQLTRDGTVVVYINTLDKEVTKKIFGGWVGVGVLGSSKFVAENPNVTRAVLKAILKAQQFMWEKSPEELRKTLPEEYTKGHEAYWPDLIKATISGMSRDGAISELALNKVADSLREGGELPKDAKIDIKKLIDPVPLADATKALKGS